MQNEAVKSLSDPLPIGPVIVPNRVFLAPMSGVTDRPFRELASRLGAGLVISEMVASDQLVRGETESVMRAERAADGPHVIQLAGREARWMGEGARAATDAGADIIDINMGCPARKVTNGYSGSALMRDIDHATRLIEATVAATPLPVTLKMRLGWDGTSINADQLARRAEQAGVRMITVHGRTRCQFYTGTADWSAIRAVKDAVSVPVIANGDLLSVGDLDRMLALSGADGVMIGRGAYGRPWLPGRLARFAASGKFPQAPSGGALATLVCAHYEAMIEYYGTVLGNRMARKHLAWYMDQLPATSAALHRAVLTETRPADVLRLIGACFAGAAEQVAA